MVMGIPLAPDEVPVVPGADEASGWLEDELAKPMYREVESEEQPDWIRDFLERVSDFIGSLGGEGTAPAWTAVLIVLAIAVLVVLFLIFGVPRLRRRSRAREVDDIFEADDERPSDVMRRAADAAATSGDWSLAIAERFRAIVRGLHERTLVSTVPGSTSHDVARRTGRSLPAFTTRLVRAADDFDAVRYLGDAGDADRYARIRALDDDLVAARPDFSESMAEPVGFEAPR